MPTKKHRRSPKKRRRLWQDEDMESVRNGNSVRGAAIEFSVPRKTLEDRVSGRVRHGAKPGVPTVLTEIEEDSLATYLVHMASCGLVHAKRSGTGERFNPDHGPSEHWWSNFMKRHPKLALRKTDSLERSRAEAFNQDIVDEYFKLLEKTLDDHNLRNNPRQLYNCDKTFLPLDYTREKAV